MVRIRTLRLTYISVTDRSYPVEVLIFLEQLGEKWEDFALFLGFTGQDLRELKDRSGGNTMQEIRHFSKVWRMPDMKQEQNNNILHRVLNTARISFGTLYNCLLLQ